MNLVANQNPDSQALNDNFAKNSFMKSLTKGLTKKGSSKNSSHLSKKSGTSQQPIVKNPPQERIILELRSKEAFDSS